MINRIKLYNAEMRLKRYKKLRKKRKDDGWHTTVAMLDNDIIPHEKERVAELEEKLYG